ncbi:MAG TPA: tetratricopeptide repeat protein [Janthinobacterium sp.]|nr:tetratricopeptide repeat protein [Janthinobacterium sp.]
MKKAFVIVTLSAALSACAVAPQQQDGPAVPVAPAVVPPPPALDQAGKTDQPDADKADADKVDTDQPGAPGSLTTRGEVLPNVELSSDLLYKLTAAELDLKRGNWQGPYVTMMGVAQQTRDPRIAHRALEIALAAKAGGEALAAIRLWHELAPDSEEATQYFLGFIVLSDQLEESEPIFAKELKDASPASRGAVMFQMQQILARAKDKLVAFAMLERLLKPYGDMQEAHLVLAQGAYGLGEPKRAEREAQKALAIKPDSELAILTLAQVTQDPAAVTALVTDFLQKNPGARDVRTAYARMLVDQKQYEQARQQFLILLKDQPDNVATLYALGIMSMELNDTATAETYFKQFLTTMAGKPKAEQDPSKVLMILSQIAEDRGDLNGAVQWLDKVDSSDERPYFNARIRRAQLIARRGDIDSARKSLAELKPGNADEETQILLADAQILRDGGYDKSAFTVLQGGVERFPDSPDLLYDFALAAEKVGDLQVMETSLRRVIAQVPDNQHAYNALGYAFAEHNVRLDEAYELIDKALKLAPGDPFIMDSMGWVQYRLGHLPEAEDLLRRAYAVRADPEIAVHLGEVLWQKGDKDNAQKMWREAKAKDPANDSLKNTLARLNLSL